MQRLSILIPTLGRSQELIETIAYFQTQTIQPFEILVVDQNTPALPEVDAVLAANPLVRHLRSSVKGISVNYNLLLQEARGEIVLYVDDDIIPDSRLIEKHLQNYEEHPTLGGVAGRVEQPSGDRDPETISEVGQYLEWTGQTIANFNARRRHDVQFSQGCNMSFRREALLKIGGFDRGFDGNGYFFETDGGLRLLDAGFRLVFDPEAEVKHLAAARGGARVPDKAQHTYHFIKNGFRLIRRHSPRVVQPVLAAKLLGYVCAKSAVNANPRILSRGLAAWCAGWLQSMRLDEGVVTSRDLDQALESRTGNEI